MPNHRFSRSAFQIVVILLVATAANAQSFRVQCPTSTITHPTVSNNNTEPAYKGSTVLTVGSNGYYVPSPSTVNGAIKCQQISGGDGYSTMADGTQTYMFSFGPLSGLADIANGLPGTQFPYVFNTPWPGCTSETNCATPLVRGDPATTDLATSGGSPGVAVPAATSNFGLSSLDPKTHLPWNGAVGLTPEIATIVTVTDLVEGPFPVTTPATTVPGCPAPTANTVTAWTEAPVGLPVGAQVVISNSTGAAGTA